MERLLEDHGPPKSAGEITFFASDGEACDLSVEKREGGSRAVLCAALPSLTAFCAHGRER